MIKYFNFNEDHFSKENDITVQLDNSEINKQTYFNIIYIKNTSKNDIANPISLSNK